MKKYLLVLLIIILCLLSYFFVRTGILAQYWMPSFEIYSSSCGAGINCTAYPAVEDVAAPSDGEFVFITAHIFDVSGVWSAVANIQDPYNPGQYMNVEYPEDGTGVMYDDGSHGDGAPGDGVYGAIIDVSDNTSDNLDAHWDYDATYYIDIFATDNLSQNSGTAYNSVPPDNIIASFVISSATDNPIVTITSPTDGASYTSASVNFSASAVPAAGASLGFLAPNLDSSLVSWWRMDDVDGSENPTDYMGNNNGTKYGDAHQISDGHFGKAFSFGGSATIDYVQIDTPNLGNGWNEITMSAWIYVNEWIGYAGIIAARDSSNNFTGLDLGDLGNFNLAMYVDTGVASGYARSSAIQAGQWYHVAGTWKSGEAPKIFIGGYNDTQTSVVIGGNIYQNDNFEIGWDKYGVRYFNGLIDETMIFNRALTPDEIRGLYDATAINHSSTLSEGQHNYEVYASDTSGNIGSAGPNIFNVGTPPVQSNWDPANNYTITDPTPAITLNTNERGDCYAATTDWGYDEMYSNTHIDCQEDSAGTFHTCQMPDLGSDGTKHIYISCEDYPAGNKDTSATNTNLVYNLTSGPWLAGWGHRKNITIQNTYVDSDLTDFPMYVKISADSNMSTALSTGNDIRFTSSDGVSPLSYEKESWSGGAGSAVTANFWVKVPIISQSTPTSIYVYYGNPSATEPAANSAYGSQNVWNSNYSLVNHFSNTSGHLLDSTSNANNSISEPGITYAQTGKIGKAVNINGTGEVSSGGYIQWDNNNSLSPGNDNFTMEAWAKSFDTDVAWGALFVDYGSNTNNLIDISQYGTHWRTVYRDTNAGSSPILAGTVDTNWHHIVGTRSGTIVSLYIDGTQAVSQNFPSLGNIQTSTGVGPLTAYRTPVPYNYVHGFPGLMDELRISKGVARSADWIKFEYRNISEADNELTWGSQE